MTPINLTVDQIQVLLLLCGHDCFHDFFQSKPVSWHTLTGGGKNDSKSSKSKQKQLTVKKKKPKKAKKGKTKKAKKAKKGTVKKVNAVNTIKKTGQKTNTKLKLQKSYETMILNELTEYFNQSLEYLQECRSYIDDHMTIYDYFEKNLSYEERERIIGVGWDTIADSGGINPTQAQTSAPAPAPPAVSHLLRLSTIEEGEEGEEVEPVASKRKSSRPETPRTPKKSKTLPPILPPISKMKRSRLEYILNQRPEEQIGKRQKVLVGGGRVRKPSALALKKMQEEHTEKLALWSELEEWDKSVEGYLSELINQQVNSRLKNHLEGKLYIQSYKTCFR